MSLLLQPTHDAQAVQGVYQKATNLYRDYSRSAHSSQRAGTSERACRLVLEWRLAADAVELTCTLVKQPHPSVGDKLTRDDHRNVHEKKDVRIE